MKIAFVIDHSPLMNLRGWQNSSTSNSQGLTFFQQSIYAIELFIQRRVQQNLFKSDKYFLFGLENSELLLQTYDESKKTKFDALFDDLESLLESKDKKKESSTDDKLQRPEFSKQKEPTSYSSRLYSGWQHPYKHFYHQLQYLECSNSPQDKNSLAKGLNEIMSVINQKRMLMSNQADQRYFGCQLSEIEPCNVIVFTVDQNFSEESYLQFLNQKPENQNLFKETLRWDQKLNVVNFGRSSEPLIKLIERYQGVNFEWQEGFQGAEGFEGLKQFISNFSSSIEPLALIDFEFQKEQEKGSFNLFFQTQGKSLQFAQKHNSNLQSAFRSNSEVKEPKCEQNLKWPIPLESKAFQVKTQSQKSMLWFGSSIPKIVIQETPIKMKDDFKIVYHSQSKQAPDSKIIPNVTVMADIIQIHDAAFTALFAQNVIGDRTNVSNLRWPVFSAGELKEKPFGYIKAVPSNTLQPPPGPQPVDQDAKKEYSLQLFVYPADFQEFCELISSLNDYTQYGGDKQPKPEKSQSKQTHAQNTQQYLKYKWKLRFDTFKDSLPPYYNEYLNSALRFVDQINRKTTKQSHHQQSTITPILLPEVDRYFRDLQQIKDREKRLVYQYLKNLRDCASAVEYEHEIQFGGFKQEHERAIASVKGVKISCCMNIWSQMEQKRVRKKRQDVKMMQKSNLRQNEGEDEVMEEDDFVEQVDQPEFEFFQLNDVMKPENFLDQVFWQVNQLSFETLQPLDFNKVFSKDQSQQSVLGQKLEIKRNFDFRQESSAGERLTRNSGNNNLIEKSFGFFDESHQTPICLMSNVEGQFRQNLQSGKYPRDPNLTHQEFMDKIRPYMGNPFYAPGTLGALSLIPKQKKASQQGSQDTASVITLDDKVSEESNFIQDAQEHKINVEIQQETKKPKKSSESKRRSKPKRVEQTQEEESLSINQIQMIFTSAQILLSNPNKKLPFSKRVKNDKLRKSLKYYLQQFSLPKLQQQAILQKLIII